jgi:endonuclease/exonuclease/phosphatase family metal-dependent hydrolase
LLGRSLTLVLATAAMAQAPVVTSTNVTVRLMAANLTGNSQKYEPPALRIFQGLKPDVVAIQEFNYSNNTPAQLRAMVDAAFGTNFVYFRESAGGYSIPNGVISRWPIRSAGSWVDVVQSQPNRGFAWAQIDLPGPDDLYVVSVHFLSGAGAVARATEATNLLALLRAHVPPDAYLVVAGDLNTDSRGETALAALKTVLSDFPIPTDAVSDGDPDTNQPRSRPYDYVLPSFALQTNQVAVTLGGESFPNGLVFDSRVFTPLDGVAPVQWADSGTVQHMGVLKDFRITYLVTNFITVPRPLLAFDATGILRWTGPSNLAYTVQATALLPAWTNLGTATSSSTNYAFTNPPPAGGQRFLRVVYP